MDRDDHRQTLLRLERELDQPLGRYRGDDRPRDHDVPRRALGCQSEREGGQRPAREAAVMTHTTPMSSQTDFDKLQGIATAAEERPPVFRVAR